MPTPKKKRESVTKTLISLIQSDPSNRSCADCRSALVDPSYVYASLCPSLKNKNRGDNKPQINVAFHDFQLTHRAFAPPDVKRDPKFGEDPAQNINQRFGGHGLFICTKCAEAHKTIGEQITKVIAVQDAAAWTTADAQFMKSSGGNARSRILYEAYLPERWRGRRPTSTTSLEDRIIFCKAKYEALAFVMPPPGPLAKVAWLSILERNETGKRFKTPGLQNIHHLVPTFPSNPTEKDTVLTGAGGGALPERLIDFFCVVSSAMQLHPREFEKDLSKLSSAEELNLWPQILDCYPTQDSHSDMIFPGHLPSFVLPNGCCPSRTQHAPTFYTFVLTLGDGDRLYGGALQIYDEHIETEELKNVILSSGYESALPAFVEHESDLVFLPKCLILLSHHPFFDMFREALLQLYRITLVEAPLPIERYIANLVSEVPLPPQGRIRVEFGFTSQKLISIERPPVNRLPMANFSYRPLFASLSVSNIMVVLGSLMEECKVALLSKHFSILTPVAEALLSALFPFEWQGLYVPLMPYTILDILDAPVPFLVGLDARYLQETPPQHRPRNVVFVDLDRDVIHLGMDDITEENRKVPCLPPRDAIKLKARLDESGGSVYLLPNSGIKGCIMEGHAELLLVPNEERPKYAQMQTVTLDESSLCRNDVLERTRKAYDENELSAGIGGFRTVHGQMKEQDGQESDTSSVEVNGRRSRKLRKPKFLRNKRVEMLESSMVASGQAHLLDMDDPPGFSSEAIRNAFLRFMVAIFENYGKFLLEGEGSDLFDENRFLRDLGEDKEPTEFMERVIKTQMFQRFLEERMENADNPEIRFYDESILAKMNRSKVKKMAKGGKLPTPFLEDESDKITRTYTPPPPSNQGLPDSMEAYHYNQFPHLQPSLIGRVRPPIIWDDRRSQSKRVRSTRSLKVRKTQQDILKRAMNPLVAPAAIAAAARKSAKDVEGALTALKGLHWDKDTKSLRSTKDVKANGERKKSERSLEASLPGKTTEADYTVTMLTEADTIMMNARRKQSILLDLIIMLQATLRMIVVRCGYKNLRTSVVQLQRHFRHVAIPAATIGKNKQRSDSNLKCVVAIQSDARRFLARRIVHRSKKAVLTLQRKTRGHLAMRGLARQKKSAATIQKLIRERRARYAYETIRDLACKIQALVRGIITRKKITAIMHGKMELYRPEIVSLWRACHAPLSLRTKLWPSFSAKPNFATHRLAETQLRRSWDMLGIETAARGKNVSDATSKLADNLGIDTAIYCICQELRQFPDHRTPSESHCESLSEAYACEEAERLQIHERLDSKTFDQRRASLYLEFGISSAEKMKKLAIARKIWSKFSLAGLSRSTMLELFPELDDGLNIVFHQASGKSKRRFPDAQKSPSVFVTKDLWENLSLEGLIRKHTKEVTRLYMTKIPSLTAKLDRIDELKKDNWRSMRCALRGTTDATVFRVSAKERSLIQGLFCKAAENPVPLKKIEDDHLYSESNFAASQEQTAPSTETNNGMDFPDVELETGDGSAMDANFPDIDLEQSKKETASAAAVDVPATDDTSANTSSETVDFPELM